jgi:transcriptional regulator with XRE-family HTH domain
LRLGLTLGAVAEVLSDPYQMVQRLEAGTAILTIPRLLKLAEAFRMDPADLLREAAAHPYEAREGAVVFHDLTDEERRLLEAWHRIPDRVQKRNLLDLMERMKD